MDGFLQAVFEHEFMRNAVLCGALASVACGVVGTFVAARRITYIAGAIAHCVLGGIGVARYLNVAWHWQWLEPLYGALAAAIVAAMVIGVVSLRAKEREDTVISSVWAIGMAVGVLCIYSTPGYSADLLSYLFGNILLVPTGDLKLLAVLDGAVLLISLLFYKQLLAVCFDEEFARLRGVNVEFYYLLLLALTGVTVVLLASVVGILMVIALLALPVAIAGHFSKALWQTMALSVVVSIVLTTSGLAVSYGPDLPAGATIIILAGFVYFLLMLGKAGIRLCRRRIRTH